MLILKVRSFNYFGLLINKADNQSSFQFGMKHVFLHLLHVKQGLHTL
jgi:hypothetical protein